jgi:hypothetical protein
MARVEIMGLEALRDSLKQFPAKLQTRAVNTGVRKASASLRTAMRRGAYAAPLAKGYKGTNKLRQSLRSAVGKKPENKGRAWVGLKKLPGAKRALSYYSVLESGRKGYTGKRRGAVKGSPPMRPFFAKVWGAQRARIGRMLVDETAKALAYEAGKALGRSKGRK